VDVPARVDERMVVTMAINLLPCGANDTCSGPDCDRLAASLNNVSFQDPLSNGVDILRAYYHYNHRHSSAVGLVYDTDFPDEPHPSSTSPAAPLAKWCVCVYRVECW
jgi:laccase